MENIIEEKPTNELHGRTLFSTKFVLDEDIKNRKILDIGCGFGWFELNAASRGCESITGIEISENDLKTAKDNINNDKIELKVGSAINLSFNDNSFDTVVVWEVIEHIPKNTEDKMFNEVNRVLKADGVFYLSTPYDSFLSKVFDPAWWLIGHRHYSKNKLISLGKNNGFKIEKLILRGEMWEIIGMLNLYISKWIFRRRPFFENFINRKQDIEFKKEKGFTNIFIKFKKK